KNMTTTVITPSDNIQTALNGVNPGGTLVFSAGTYTISSTIVFTSGGTPFTDITLRGEPGAKIVPGATFDSKLFDLGSDPAAASRIRFENLTFDMSALTGSPTASYVIYGDKNSDVSVIGCRFFNSLFGVYLIDQTRVEFIGNEVAKPGAASWGYWGFLLAGAKGAIVRRNKAHNNPIDGLKFGPPTVSGSGTVSVTNGLASVTTSGTSLTTADI